MHQALRTSTKDLGQRLKNVKCEWDNEGGKLEGHFHYLSFRDGLPTTDELISIACDRIINFAIPRQYIEKAKFDAKEEAGDYTDPYVRINREARDLFIETLKDTPESRKRSGEFGELLLFMLMEWVLNAPILVSKMYLKTAKQMPVYGTDGIHISTNGETMSIYWGVSKLHQKLETAIESINVSVSTAKDENEIRLVKLGIDLANLSQEHANELKDFFNPYH